MTITELIRKRRSVRTYAGRPSAQDAEKLKECLERIVSPFGSALEFRLLDAQEYGLKSPVISGTDLYLAAKCRREEQYELSVGYCFEKACLKALDMKIGTVMLGGTMNRDAFEKAMELKEDEAMPVVSPLGYIAAKMSIRESLMRRGVGADSRKPFGSLFYAEDFAHPLKEEQAGIYREALEGVQLSPSAVNHQPWRAVAGKDGVHFFLVRSMKESSPDLQKTDMGIALCHFDLVMKEQGCQGEFAADDPGISVPEKTEYIVTYHLK